MCWIPCSFLRDCGKLVIFIKRRATHLRAISVVCIIYFLIYPLPCSLSLRTTINKTSHAEQYGLCSQIYIYSGNFYANVTGEIFHHHQKSMDSVLDSFILHLFFKLNILLLYITNFQLGSPKEFCNQCRQTLFFNTYEK